ILLDSGLLEGGGLLESLPAGPDGESTGGEGSQAVLCVGNRLVDPLLSLGPRCVAALADLLGSPSDGVEDLRPCIIDDLAVGKLAGLDRALTGGAPRPRGGGCTHVPKSHTDLTK